MTPAPLRPFPKKSTPAPLLFSKFVKTSAGVHSDTPAPVHLCKVASAKKARKPDPIMTSPTSKPKPKTTSFI